MVGPIRQTEGHDAAGHRDDPALAQEAIAHTAAERVLELQRGAGNQAVTQLLAPRRVARQPTTAPAEGRPLPKVDVKHDVATASYLVLVDGIPVARAGIHEGADARLDVEATQGGVTVVLKHNGDAELLKIEDPGASLGIPVTLTEVELKETGSSRGVGPAFPSSSPGGDPAAKVPLFIGPPDSLRWPDNALGESELQPSLPPGSLGEFEMQLRGGNAQIVGRPRQSR